MWSSFFQAVCRVGIFMICAQAMVHFRPQEAYEKYLKLLVSVMVLIQLFLPIGGFLLRGGGQEAARLLEQFQRELEQEMRNAAESAEAADALLEQMTLEEVMRRLEEQRSGAGGEDGLGEGHVWGEEIGGSGQAGQGLRGILEGTGGAVGQSGAGGAAGQDSRDSLGGLEKEESGNLDGQNSQDSGDESSAGGIRIGIETIEPVVIRSGSK